MKPVEHIICKEIQLAAPVRFLTLDWMHGDVHITPGADPFIRVIQRASARFPFSRCFAAEVGNDTLSLIDGCKHAFPLGMNFKRTSLSILLPPNVMERITLKSVGTRIVIDNMDTQYLDCHCTSSKLNVSGHARHFSLRAVGSQIECMNLHTNQLKLHATSSPTQLHGQLAHVQSRTTGSTLSIHSSTMLQSLDHVSTSSHMDLRIPDYNGFTLNFKQTGGRLKSDFSLQKNGDQHVYLDGTHPFQVKVRGGSLRLGKYSTLF
ncbi:DUF4097 family beta strand repeat-containing protein [Paenibacillus xylanilyticus]|uniref:DUF4097 family beta strand repeat-containing protein n=1 Tax=Paenibacillus xylanilyticus TaxID=248903 RepID=UPI0039A0BDCE